MKYGLIAHIDCNNIWGINTYIDKCGSSTYTSLAYMGYYNIYHKYGLLTHINGYDIWGNITYRYKWVSSTYTCLVYGVRQNSVPLHSVMCI